jgi:hypothetical protein
VLTALAIAMLALCAPVIVLVLLVTSLLPSHRVAAHNVLSEAFLRAIVVAVVFSFLNWFATYEIDSVLLFIAFGLTFTGSSIYLSFKVFWKTSASDHDSKVTESTF